MQVYVRETKHNIFEETMANKDKLYDYNKRFNHIFLDVKKKDLQFLLYGNEISRWFRWQYLLKDILQRK